METALKLQRFAEIATYYSTTLRDTSDRDNRQQAEIYLRTELGFLGSRDLRELKEVWNYTCLDGRDTRLLFTAVKTLQERYDRACIQTHSRAFQEHCQA